MAPWRGRLFLFERRLLYVGPVGTTPLHAHHAFQVMLTETPVSLRSASSSLPPCTRAILPPDVPHAIESPSPSALLLYFDADDRTGRSLRPLVSTDPRNWVSMAEQWLPPGISQFPHEWHGARHLVDTLLQGLVGTEPRPQALHPSLKRLLALLPETLDGDVRLETLATRVGLSASRLSHLFSEQVGIALRPYVLWLRLHRAARCIAAGGSLTVAAHEAGFADSAHLNRTFHRMFGIAPSELTDWVEWVKEPDV